MTDQDQVRPYHAKDVATGQETADTLAEVLKHAAARDEAAKQKTAPRPQPKWLLPFGVNLAVLAVYLLIAPPSWVVLNPIEPPPTENRIAGVRRAMVFQAARIESYRQQNGRLPASLADAGSVVPGIEYLVRGQGYQLIGSVGEETILYDSSVPLADWAAELDLASQVRG